MADKPKQHLFVSQTTINIGSTTGRSIQFDKGVPTHVPREMHGEVMARGIFPCDEHGKILEKAITDPQEKPAGKMAPEDPEERALQVLEAIKLLVERNSPQDFTGGGVPRDDVLTSLLGYRVDAREIRTIWAKFKPELLSTKKAA